MPFFSSSNSRGSEKTQQNGPVSLNKAMSSDAQNNGQTAAPQPLSSSPNIKLGNDKSGIDVRLEGQNADQLEGSVGLFQGVKNIFGATDTFSKVQQTLELYQGEKNPDKKELKRQEAIQLGQQFLKENNTAQNLKNANNLKKYQSIERIVEKLQKENIVVDNLDKKITVGAKISSFFTGKESTFTLIDKAYSSYLNLSSKSINNIPGLIQLLSTGAELVDLMNTWEEKHGKGTSKEILSKKSSINTIRANLGALSILIKATEYLSIQAAGITLDCFNLATESVLIPVVRLDVNLGEGKVFQAEANNVLLSKSGAELSNARFTYSGDMQFADLITISNINGSINTVGKDQYDFSLAGTLAVDTGDSKVAQLTTSGKASALYHGSSLTSEVIIDEGKISLVVGNDFNMELNGLSFQEGVLLAEQTSLIFHYNENEFTGDVSGLSLTHDTVDWNEAAVAYSGRIGLGDVVGVTNPTGKLKGSAGANAMDLQGLLSIDLPGLTVSGDVHLANSGLGIPITTEVTNGAVNGEIGKIFKINATGINYSEAAGLTATAAALEANLGPVGNVSGEAKEVSINQTGVDWKEATLNADKLTAGPISATQVTGTVQGSTGANAMDLNGVLAIDLPGLTASGNVHMANTGLGTPITTELTNGAINGEVGKIFKINATGVNYSEAAGLTATAAALEANLGPVGNVSGEAKEVSMSQTGVDWKEATLNADKLTAGPISATQVTGTVQGSAGANAMDLNGILAIDLPGLKASGNVHMANTGLGTPITAELTNGTVNGEVGKIFKISATGVNYSEAAGLTATAASLEANLGPVGNVSGEATEVSINQTGVDWKEATLNADKLTAGPISATQVTGTVQGSTGANAMDLNGILAIDLPGLKASGNVHMANTGSGTPITTELTNGAVNGKIAKILEINVTGVNYSETAGLTATAASLEANLGPVGNVSGEVKDVAINQTGVDWKEATLRSDTTIGFENIATISNLSGHILGASGNYAKELSGEVSFSPKVPGLGNIEASGAIKAAQNSNAGTWTFELTNGSINADLFGFMHIEESNLGYSDGEMTLEAPTITMVGNVPGFLNGFSVRGSKIVIGNGLIDWAKIEVGLGKKFELGRGLSATLPNLLLYGSAGNYNMEFRDAQASLSIGDAFSAQGDLTMRYERKKNQLQIMSAILNLSGKSPEIPGNIPGLWPFSLDFIFSLIPAGIPAEAGIGIYANGSVSAGIEGEVRYDESNPGIWQLTGSPSLAGKIAFGVKASAGIGSRVLVYVGIYLAAEAEASAKGTVDLSTEIVMNEDNFGLSMAQSKATYEIEADLRALLKGGVEARALYFFGTTLYEMVFKEWHIGHTDMSGELSLANGKTTKKSASGIFSGNKDAVPDPAKSGAIRSQTKASGTAFNALAKAQELLGNNGNSAEIKAFLGRNGIAKEQEFNLIKQKVAQSFMDSIRDVELAKNVAEQELSTMRDPVQQEIFKLTQTLGKMKDDGKDRINDTSGIMGSMFGSTITKKEVEAKLVAKRNELTTFDILEARAINARNELNEIRETFGNLEQLLMSRSSDLTGTSFAQDVLNKSEMLAKLD